MSFYSYKNSGSTHCPCNVSGSDVLSGLNEKICIQVQRVYDSCLMQEQLAAIWAFFQGYTGNGIAVLQNAVYPVTQLLRLLSLCKMVDLIIPARKFPVNGYSGPKAKLPAIRA